MVLMTILAGFFLFSSNRWLVGFQIVDSFDSFWLIYPKYKNCVIVIIK